MAQKCNCQHAGSGQRIHAESSKSMNYVLDDMGTKPNPREPVANESAAEEFRLFHDRYRFYVEQNGALTEKAFELNKQIISSHERMLLIAVGTIGLSITAFMTLVGKFPTYSFKHVLAWCISCAWILLFISAMCYRAAIAHTLLANSKLYKHWAALLQTYHSQMFATSLTKLSRALKGEVDVAGESKDVEDLFQGLANDLNNSGSPVENELVNMLQIGSDTASPVRILALLGIITMQLGFFFLCVAAIKGFLAV